MTTTTERIFNFSAGPAVLPVKVPRRGAARSHGAARRRHVHPRDQPSLEAVRRCDRRVRGRPARACRHSSELPRPLFAGGASLQFSMVPMNLMPAGGSANYVVTGSWSEKAVKEAKRVGGVKIAASTAGENLRARAKAERADARSGRRLHALHDEQHDLRHRVALRARRRECASRSDTSSDMFSRPIDVGSLA